VGTSPLSERVAVVQDRVYGPLTEQVRRSPLHSDVLGHSLHPPLTDVVLGCWLSASVLDLAGGVESRHAATVLAGAGLLASVPTAIAGAADYADLSGEQRRTAAVHALGTDAAILLVAASLVARLRGDHRSGDHRSGVRRAAAANLVLAGAGFLGGHLALSRGTARRRAPVVGDG
jgi:uncharacterized membrane protein